MSAAWTLDRLHELSVFKEGDEGPLLAARNDGRDVVVAGWDEDLGRHVPRSPPLAASRVTTS